MLMQEATQTDRSSIGPWRSCHRCLPFHQAKYQCQSIRAFGKKALCVGVTRQGAFRSCNLWHPRLTSVQLYIYSPVFHVWLKGFISSWCCPCIQLG